MSTTIEIVRFDVPSDKTDDLLGGHERARLAIDSVSPGWIWSRLATFGEGSWVEVVAWNDRAAFDRALELSVDEPDAADWFGLADPGWTIVLGEPVVDPGAVPPQSGTLELSSTGPGADAALVATPDDRSAWSMLLELDGRVWKGDSWQRSAPGMLRITVPAPDRGPAVPSWTEVASIAHSYDAVESSVGPG